MESPPLQPSEPRTVDGGNTMQPMAGLNELREQGKMTWLEEEHGWLAALSILFFGNWWRLLPYLEASWRARRELHRQRILAVARGRCPKCAGELGLAPYRGVELDKCARCQGCGWTSASWIRWWPRTPASSAASGGSSPDFALPRVELPNRLRSNLTSPRR